MPAKFLRIFRLQVLLVAVLFWGALGFAISDIKTEKLAEIKNEISKANNCKKDSDCAEPIQICPFGCEVIVNKKEYTKILKLLSANTTGCEYECAHVSKIACANGRCEGKR